MNQHEHDQDKTQTRTEHDQNKSRTRPGQDQDKKNTIPAKDIQHQDGDVVGRRSTSYCVVLLLNQNVRKGNRIQESKKAKKNKARQQESKKQESKKARKQETFPKPLHLPNDTEGEHS